VARSSYFFLDYPSPLPKYIYTNTFYLGVVES
ncbi:unnamed protein product, partial [marine sediment metagenome]